VGVLWTGAYQVPRARIVYTDNGQKTAFEEASLWSGRRVTTIWGISVVIMAP
jgi:hypothetical protein